MNGLLIVNGKASIDVTSVLTAKLLYAKLLCLTHSVRTNTFLNLYRQFKKCCPPVYPFFIVDNIY